MRGRLAVLICTLTAQAASAQDMRWVTFRSRTNDWGVIQDQIDRRTIQPAGRYRTFWTRMWRVHKKEPLVASYYGSLIFWSQKFAVDCERRKFGRDLVDSNLPSERRHRVGIDAMRWQSLDKYPAVEKTVCARFL